MQFGSGWWFNDQKDGMQRQMTQLAQLGLLSRFVGMLTDSRSFLSYTRHEYFRRILCQMIGRWVTDGEAPADIALLGEMVKTSASTTPKLFRHRTGVAVIRDRFMQSTIKIHEQDNVAVALRDLAAGETVELAGVAFRWRSRWRAGTSLRSARSPRAKTSSNMASRSATRSWLSGPGSIFIRKTPKPT